MRQNHLLEPIHCILDTATASLSEYELIQQLQKQGWLAPITLGDSVSLYSTHFIVYNALYQLKIHYQSAGRSLLISALAIELSAVLASNVYDSAVRKDGSAESNDMGVYNQADSEGLRSYYLDWDNLDEATEDSIDGLLNSFWQRYVSEDECQQAFVVLGLECMDGYPEIKAKYRQLAMQHHPDRGGDVEAFQAIQQAFSLLQRRYGSGH
jgi:hypothetical protein